MLHDTTTQGLLAFEASSSSRFSLPKVSLVIPTLNEAENLTLMIPQLPLWLHELLIVDGCSTDGTIETAKRLCPGVRIVIEKRRGKGVALMTGFEAATGDIVVMMDADGSMDPEEIILFVAALMSGAGFVKGSRFIQGAGTVDMTYIRMLGNWALTLAVRLLYGGSFSDLCYGYIAFWRKHLPILRSELRRLRGRDPSEHPGAQEWLEDRRGCELRIRPNPRRQQSESHPRRLEDPEGDPEGQTGARQDACPG